MATLDQNCRLAVDVGGTFTDLVLVSGGRVEVKKVLSTPPNFNIGIVAGIRALTTESGLSLSDVRSITHATTVGSNTVATLNGPITGLLTTKGFGDILEIARMSLPVQNDLRWHKRTSLAERWLVREVDERVSHDGCVVKKLDRQEAKDAVHSLVAEEGVTSLAVSLINSYANDVHEREIKVIATEFFPSLRVSLSSEV